MTTYQLNPTTYQPYTPPLMPEVQKNGAYDPKMLTLPQNASLTPYATGQAGLAQQFAEIIKTITAVFERIFERLLSLVNPQAAASPIAPEIGTAGPTTGGVSPVVENIKPDEAQIEPPKDNSPLSIFDDLKGAFEKVTDLFNLGSTIFKKGSRVFKKVFEHGWDFLGGIGGKVTGLIGKGVSVLKKIF